MVGYALSAASEDSFENILITVIDADDFAFVSDSVNTSVYAYSRKHRVARRLGDASESDENIPYKLIYDIVSVIRNEEMKWGFPMALVWSYPDFGNLELVSAEFQETWPAVMLMRNYSDVPYVNVTGAFFDERVYPLEASFLCDVLNTVAFSMGIYVSEGFCSCYNSLFCSAHILEIEKLLFKSRFLKSCVDEKVLSEVFKHCKGKSEVKKRIAVKMLKESMDIAESKMSSHDMRSELILIKRKCVSECVSEVCACLEKHIDDEQMYENLKKHIACATEAIVNMGTALSDKYITDIPTDIRYVTFDDLLSALTFADERMDLKSVVRIARKKNAVAKRNAAPAAVFENGKKYYISN